jgi:hypothetical protein
VRAAAARRDPTFAAEAEAAAVRGSLHAQRAAEVAARDARVRLPSRWAEVAEVAAIPPHHVDRAAEVAAASMGRRVQRQVVAVAAGWALPSATQALRLRERETACLRSRAAGGTASSRR